MKKFFVFMAIVLVSCNPEQIETITIGVDDASTMVYSFLKDKHLHADGTPNSIPNVNTMGGVFPANLFNLSSYAPGDSAGVMLWFCYDGSKFFVALEHIKKYYWKKCPRFPASDTLVTPINTFDFLGSPGMDISKSKDHITNQKLTGVVGTIEKSKVKIYNRDFLNLVDDQGDKYCNYGFSCFGNNDPQDYKNFLDKIEIGGYVRYYFAYDPSQKSNNRIRVVLVACDKSGKKIDGSKTATSGSTPDGTIVEESWPPPPPYN